MGRKIARLHNKLRTRWGKDSIYESFWINKLLSTFTKDGKTTLVETSFYKAFKNIKFLSHKNPYFIVMDIIELIKPNIFVVPLQLGSRWVRIPIPIFTIRQYRKALRWLKYGIKVRNDKQFVTRIITEIWYAHCGVSTTIKKQRDSLNNLIYENKVKLHYRWK